MTFDIGLHEVCVPVGGRAGVRYFVTKFSRLDSLPNFLTHGAPLRARKSSANKSGRHLEFLINDVIRRKISTWPTWLLTMNPQFVHVVW